MFYWNVSPNIFFLGIDEFEYDYSVKWRPISYDS